MKSILTYIVIDLLFIRFSLSLKLKVFSSISAKALLADTPALEVIGDTPAISVLLRTPAARVIV
jgi:hypothetical protein